MKILLLNPPYLSDKGKFSREQRSPAVTKSGTFYYPMWLAYTTGVLEDAGFECKLIDAPASGVSLDDVVNNQLAEFRPEIIVLATSTPSIANDVAVAVRLKEKFGAYTILVGTHASALPEEVLQMDAAMDAVVRGEFEFPVLKVAQCFQAEKRDLATLQQINGLSFRWQGQIFHNPLAVLPHDLDALPFVSRVYKEHLNHHDYFYAHSKYPIVSLITSRGCPHRCVYCVYPQVFSGHKLRYRSVGNVVDEIDYILTAFPDIKEIMFEDDTLTINKKRCFDFAREIQRRGLKFHWSANSRCDVDYDTLKILHQSGLRLLCVGVESGVQEILDNMKKSLKIERIREFFKDAKRAGVMIHGCFLLGNPGETKATLEKTLQLAKELNPDTAQFFPIMVYPGTEAYEWAKDNNYLTTEDFPHWLNQDGMHNCVVSRPGLSNTELVAFCDRARKEFYLRPTYIFSKFFQGLKDPYELMRLAKGARNLLKSMLIGSKGAKSCNCR
jgi:anaerobic magnesium-protoporphyrin IX monomethyl ester cyclase